jgi:hypothetical protein
VAIDVQTECRRAQIERSVGDLNNPAEGGQGGVVLTVDGEARPINAALPAAVEFGAGSICVALAQYGSIREMGTMFAGNG